MTPLAKPHFNAKQSNDRSSDASRSNVSEWLQELVLRDCEDASGYSPFNDNRRQCPGQFPRLLGTATANPPQAWPEQIVVGRSADLCQKRFEAMQNVRKDYFGIMIEIVSANNCTSSLTLYDPMALKTATPSIHDVLSSLVGGNPAKRKQARISLLKFDPAELVVAALSHYDRIGNTEVLLHLRSLLEDLGARAWDSLTTIAESGREECELFIEPIVRCATVQDADRIAALRSLAINPSPSVRSRLYEYLWQFKPEHQKAILEVLLKDPDCDISAEAAHWLSSLNEDP
jgi:hypothetical protein